jgi:hypothetical protein
VQPFIEHSQTFRLNLMLDFGARISRDVVCHVEDPTIVVLGREFVTNGIPTIVLAIG